MSSIDPGSNPITPIPTTTSQFSVDQTKTQGGSIFLKSSSGDSYRITQIGSIIPKGGSSTGVGVKKLDGVSSEELLSIAEKVCAVFNATIKPDTLNGKAPQTLKIEKSGDVSVKESIASDFTSISNISSLSDGDSIKRTYQAAIKEFNSSLLSLYQKYSNTPSSWAEKIKKELTERISTSTPLESSSLEDGQVSFEKRKRAPQGSSGFFNRTTPLPSVSVSDTKEARFEAIKKHITDSFEELTTLATKGKTILFPGPGKKDTYKSNLGSDIAKTAFTDIGLTEQQHTEMLDLIESSLTKLMRDKPGKVTIGWIPKTEDSSLDIVVWGANVGNCNKPNKGGGGQADTIKKNTILHSKAFGIITTP